MRNLRPGCISFLFFSLIPCVSLLAQPQKLYLNPAKAAAAPQSKFIEITKFIPVNSPSQKVSSNVALFITKKYWALYDYNDKKIIFLNKEGKYIKTIEVKKYGNASIEYDDKNDVLKFNIKNKNYSLIEKDLVKIRANYAKKSNQKYFKNYEIDLKEENLQIKRTATNPYFIINASWYYDDYYYQSDLSVDPKAKDTAGYELQILRDYKPVQSFFPFNKTTNNFLRYASSNSQVEFFNTDTAYVKYTARPFNTTIYKLNKDSMQALYELILPAENVIPQSVVKNGFKSKADWEGFRGSNGAIFTNIDDIANVKSYLFFGLAYMRKYQSFVYDKKENKFYNTDKIKGDSSQFNIHLLQNGLGQLYGGKYYKVIAAQSLVDFHTKNKDKTIVYPPELELFLKTASKNSNPVIVEYQLKD